MYFLIEYDRQRGQLLAVRTFEDADRQASERERLQLELTLSRQGIEHEVVVLQAPSEEALRRTHRRYFENLKQLASTTPTADER